MDVLYDSAGHAFCARWEASEYPDDAKRCRACTGWGG